LVREFLLMLCVDTDKQKHTSHQNQEDSKRPFLESREFIWISVFGKPFYVDHGYFEKQISFVRSFFSGILVLFSIDGIYIRIFRQIRNIASVFERNVFERVRFCQRAECLGSVLRKTAEYGNYQIPQTNQNGDCRCHHQKDVIFHVLQTIYAFLTIKKW